MKLFVISIALLGAAIQVSGKGVLVPDKCHDEFPVTSKHTSGDALTKDEQCLLKCAIMSHGVINESGEIFNDKAQAVTNEFGTQEQKDRVEKMKDSCKKNAGSDKDLCALSYKYVKCFGEDVVDRYME